MPNPVWSSEIGSREEFVDLEDGMWTRIRSPMGVVMETRWSVTESELVQDVMIFCNRMLMGIVRGQTEANFDGIHERMLKGMVEGKSEVKK
jgi:hypothetical protein